MKNKLIEAAKVVLALVVVAALGWIAFRLFMAVIQWLSSVRSDLSTAIVVAAATVAASLVTVGVGKYLERKAAIGRELRLKKIPVYEDLISSIFTFFQQGKPGFPKAGEAPTIREQTHLIQNVILWGSDAVLKQFGEFRVAILQFDASRAEPSPLIAMEKLMLAIRKDLGYKNDTIITGDILRLFINDFAEYQASKATGKREA